MLFQVRVITENWRYILSGLPLTFYISLVSIGFGLVIGLVAGTMRLSKSRIVSGVPGFFIELFRNTPVFVQIVWFHYSLPILVGIKFSPIQSGIIALGLNAGAYLAEVFRGGILAIDIGQTEASMALGFSYLQAMRRVILPQAVRKMLPAFVNTFVLMIKQSALVSYIGVMELFHRANDVTIATFRPIEIYTTVAVVYFVICWIGSQLMAVLETRLAISERR
ncbi:MAG: amino acid ABC transporter permease [Actinobacteria bacterium]|nr:amino acid ABC transporter permease [Actinomycetota bacterium]